MAARPSVVGDDQVGAGPLDRRQRLQRGRTVGRAGRAPRPPRASRTRRSPGRRRSGTCVVSRTRRITSRYGIAGFTITMSAPSATSSSTSRSASLRVGGIHLVAPPVALLTAPSGRRRGTGRRRRTRTSRCRPGSPCRTARRRRAPPGSRRHGRPSCREGATMSAPGHGVRHRRLREQLQRDVVVNVPVAQHAAVAVGRVLAQADVGDQHQVGHRRRAAPAAPAGRCRPRRRPRAAASSLSSGSPNRITAGTPSRVQLAAPPRPASSTERWYWPAQRRDRLAQARRRRARTAAAIRSAGDRRVSRTIDRAAASVRRSRRSRVAGKPMWSIVSPGLYMPQHGGDRLATNGPAGDGDMDAARSRT